MTTAISTAPILDRRRSRNRLAELPAAPVTWFLVGYPVWWAIGLGTLIYHIIAVIMVILLWRSRVVRVPPGFGWWVLFLGAVIISLAMLGFNPPGTIPQGVSGRLLVALFRLSQYLAVTIMLLYVYNLKREKLSNARLGWQLGLLFVYSVALGSLSIVVPNLEWPSPVELVLPGPVGANAWIVSMVHPSLAQVQDFLGYEHGRPAAPFGYTNTWGAAVAMLLPWFVATWIVMKRGWSRAAGLVILAISIVPIVWSVNRGLWIAIVIMLIVSAILLVRNGRMAVLLIGTAATLLVGFVLAVSPLAELATERLDNPHSNTVREFTTEKAIELSAQSPLIGFGTTRNAEGSAQSIAIGETPDCPQCGVTPLGQNGQIWMVLIGQGVIGVILFYGMFVRTSIEAFRSKGLLMGAAAASLSAGLLMTVYYDMIVAPLALFAIIVAATWRVREGDET